MKTKSIIDAFLIISMNILPFISVHLKFSNNVFIHIILIIGVQRSRSITENSPDSCSATLICHSCVPLFFRESHVQSPQSMQDQGANVAWQHLNGLADGDSINYSEIDCVINDEYKVACRREGQEVYLPFSFVGKYFEVSDILL